MPLKEGSSKETISTNIEHCMSVYKKTGKVSGNHVSSSKEAMKICSAMAYDNAKSKADSDALSAEIGKRRK